MELKELQNAIKNTNVSTFQTDHGISWKYIVERAACWGGFYERMVHSVRISLRKNLGRSSLTHTELETFLIEMKFLEFFYSDLKEQFSLIPAHLLFGKRLLGLPAIGQNDSNRVTKENFAKHFRLWETLLNHF